MAQSTCRLGRAATRSLSVDLLHEPDQPPGVMRLDDIRGSVADHSAFEKNNLTGRERLRVKNIRRIEGDHDIDCKIDGFGAIQLKSEFVKKA